MRSLNHGGQEFFRRIVDVDQIHLRARHHDVARCEFGGLQHAFDHRQRFSVEQIAFARRLQQLDQLAAVFRLAHQERGEALEQTGLGQCR